MMKLGNKNEKKQKLHIREMWSFSFVINVK